MVMRPVDLTKISASYKSGWVAINKGNKVIAHAQTFASISKKIKNMEKEVVLLPASKNYFGFITTSHVKISVRCSSK